MAADDRALRDTAIRAYLREVLLVPVADAFTFANPVVGGATCPVCDEPAVEVACGVWWAHAPCVQRLARAVVAVEIAAAVEQGGALP